MVWADPRSIATTRGITFVLFSSGYLDVSVLRVSFPCGMLYLQYNGLPHSETHGSTVICTSPWLIAACHVLLRLWEPRHPPYALNYFSFYYMLVHIIILFSKFSLLTTCQRTFWLFNLSVKQYHTPFLSIQRALWRISESNRWPPACKAGALANWANSPKLNNCSPAQIWTADLYIISVAL